MFCENCGRMVDGSSSICPYCNKPILRGEYLDVRDVEQQNRDQEQETRGTGSGGKGKNEPPVNSGMDPSAPKQNGTVYKPDDTIDFKRYTDGNSGPLDNIKGNNSSGRPQLGPTMDLKEYMRLHPEMFPEGVKEGSDQELPKGGEIPKKKKLKREPGQKKKEPKKEKAEKIKRAPAEHQENDSENGQDKRRKIIIIALVVLIVVILIAGITGVFDGIGSG